ncbi:leucine-rich repeat-containing G-protein coupled receptor 4-like isoform X2 [Varroa destructor]|uniref:Uncharacterized protein n=1 Tax=Varroa destructor TaxID=109461 RepID=A0A7M7L2W2_VARDE|nr:leucine-rich repeat-containing G-protein coupled receptor 4-like isoform X2 [Varroa destructor]
MFLFASNDLSAKHSAMRSLVSVILYGALLIAVALPGARAGPSNLCDLRADPDGVQCECNEHRVVCEVTSPNATFTSYRSQLQQEALKKRRAAETLDELVLQSSRNESFLNEVPRDILKDQFRFKNISMARANLGHLVSGAVTGTRFLKKLSLTACGISGLFQNAISKLQNLQDLDLSHNQITIISFGALKDLPSLKYLTIAHSEVENIEPHAFVELTSLEKLSLKDNEIKEVDNLLFTGLSNLREVELNYNYIQKLDDDTFRDLPQLRSVDLRGNSLTTITDSTFHGMHNLNYLSLYYNNLQHLPVGFLKDSPDLKELNLEKNRLQVVTLDMLRGLRAIRSDFTLRLKSNPLICSCKLYYLTELRKRRTNGLKDDHQEPSEFKNLQCRQRMVDHDEPRSFDQYLATLQCVEDPTLSEHIVDQAVVAGVHTMPQPSRITLFLAQVSTALTSCLIVRWLHLH